LPAPWLLQKIAQHKNLEARAVNRGIHQYPCLRQKKVRTSLDGEWGGKEKVLKKKDRLKKRRALPRTHQKKRRGLRDWGFPETEKKKV